ncbi:MAG TPA: hypothetical protein PKW37_02935 [Salinivirgaceae bacterium]|nr:hypothetical protein [Salinivirgaceae bacterium]
MKTKLLLIGLLLGLISCGKENPKIEDYREKIAGDYVGIQVDTRWINTTVGYTHDTSDVTITLTLSKQDSIVDIAFNPPYYYNFSFKYTGDRLISTTDFHPPTLNLKNDSLYFKHQAGLGPIWMECFCKKN